MHTGHRKLPGILYIWREKNVGGEQYTSRYPIYLAEKKMGVTRSIRLDEEVEIM